MAQDAAYTTTTFQILEVSSCIHWEILVKCLRRFEIHFRHKSQEVISDLNDLLNKQISALQYKLLNTLLQSVQKIANILVETVAMTPFIANISFPHKLVKNIAVWILIPYIWPHEFILLMMLALSFRLKLFFFNIE